MSTERNQRRTLDEIEQLGLAQAGDAVLATAAARFRLPAERPDATATLARLRDAAERLRATGSFNNGIGIAAPQLGAARAAAVVLPPPGPRTVALLNPRVEWLSPELDSPQYEGCLSFFGVSGLLRRPLSARVSWCDPDGRRTEETFTHGLARLVTHELDHLAGTLYTERIEPSTRLVAVESEPLTRARWRYPPEPVP